MRPNPIGTRLCTMHDLCMPTKTISIETDVYSLLKRAKLRRESFSQVIRRLMADPPAETLGELELALKEYEGVHLRRRCPV